MNKTKKSQSGVTLAELLVVAALVGIVASIAVMAYGGALERARQRGTMADMRAISRAIEAYAVDHHRFPDDSGGLAALQAAIVPYSSSVLPVADHWGNDYRYVRDAADNYSIESFGKDGTDGIDLAYGEDKRFERDIVLVNGVFVGSPE